MRWGLDPKSAPSSALLEQLTLGSPLKMDNLMGVMGRQSPNPSSRYVLSFFKSIITKKFKTAHHSFVGCVQSNRLTDMMKTKNNIFKENSRRLYLFFPLYNLICWKYNIPKQFPGHTADGMGYSPSSSHNFLTESKSHKSDASISQKFIELQTCPARSEEQLIIIEEDMTNNGSSPDPWLVKQTDRYTNAIEVTHSIFDTVYLIVGDFIIKNIVLVRIDDNFEASRHFFFSIFSANWIDKAKNYTVILYVRLYFIFFFR